MLCGHFPSVRKGLGVFAPSVWGGGHQHLRCLYAHSCTFYVVHYVSHFDYGSNCYSSSYSAIFWPVFRVISDSVSFPDRVSSKLGSAWHDSTTTLDAERLWRCSWLSFCATAATSIFNASFSLCQLCYGFSTGRFLFRVGPSIICFLYMFGVNSGVCFLLLGAELDAVFTYGGSTIRVCTLATLLKFTHGRHMCNLMMVIGPHLVCIEWLLPLLPWVGWSLLQLILLGAP